MPFRTGRRLALACCALFALGCSHEETPGRGNLPTPEVFSAKDAAEERKPHKDLLKDEIPSDQLDKVMAAHFEGLGYMEQYGYPGAVKAFREVHERAPGWIAGSINLAIALLNDTGLKAEKSKGAGQAPSKSNFEEALELLDDVIDRDPANLHSHFCRAIIYEYLGDFPNAHSNFVFVTEKDPADAHAWYGAGRTLTRPAPSGGESGSGDSVRQIKEQSWEQVRYFRKALELNPYLWNAYYALGRAYAQTEGINEAYRKTFALYQALNPQMKITAPGETTSSTYGEAGRYAQIIDPFAKDRPSGENVEPPRFGKPEAIAITPPEGHRWAAKTDFTGPLALAGRLRDRFGAGVAVFDANGDGNLDVFLTAAIHGPKGLRDALLLNRGDGKFEDVSDAWGLPADRVSLGVAAGDFDADRRVDLFLTGVGDNRLLRNADGKRFEDVTAAAKVAGAKAISLTARWLDLDQDGDLDLYVVNYTDRAHAEQALVDAKIPGAANEAYRNDGVVAPIKDHEPNSWAPLAMAPSDVPASRGLSIAFSAFPESSLLGGGTKPHTGVAALDVDDDRDTDLVLAADGEPLQALVNDRLGRFHVAPVETAGAAGEPTSGLLVTDLDKDGRSDLVAIRRGGRVAVWRNNVERSPEVKALSFQDWPTDAREWREAVAADLDLDTWPDLLGLPASADPPTLDWARNDSQRLSTQALGFATALERPVGFAFANMVGDPLPDFLVIADAAPPRLARNLGNGEHWLALDLTGLWHDRPKHMRTNSHALGTRVALNGQGLQVTYENTTPGSGLAQSVVPIVLGLGKSPSAELLRLRWPDGNIQCELNVQRDKPLSLVENNRKEGSCPVLFTWNGSRFVCMGDFLGGGGLGYLVAPGVYSQPDRDEAVAIAADQLRAVDGTYRLSVTEPMDEVAYLDQLVLEVVDRPPGVSATPDERFVPEGPRPTGRIIAWRDAIEPIRATDLNGHDETETLRAWDRKTVDGFGKRAGWIGYAEEHGIVLDFGDRLSRFGPNDRLVLCLAGWVEYPYSQTNYAAATAGVTLRAPMVERLLEDGRWQTVEPHAGYPAGLPRMTTLDLTGKLTGGRCTIRLRTNMECYWDQAFIAVALSAPGINVTALPVARGVLGDRGYTREVSPDGRQPLLYDYEYVDPAPLARLSGRLTRLGDVAPLLRADDDQLCLVGPGDEVRLEFDARRAPALAAGWTRSYVLRAVGYCKDVDPFTATSDQVGPLPWRGMPDYPFGPSGERPVDAPYRAYLSEYQTRHSTSR
jgi:tetratricopeptide (TPR) repeat protein